MPLPQVMWLRRHGEYPMMTRHALPRGASKMSCNVPHPIEEPDPAEESEIPRDDRPHYLISDLPKNGSVTREPDIDAKTRHLLAVILSTSSSATLLLVVIGGLLGRFDASLVEGAITALSASAGPVAAFFFFRRNRP
ncbi:hypothetical protein [Actinoallomurus soli]|uniref:hypothetical protein n=1 Tax=Actinoallomurus soli TaxID=2952535 RepID=UPI0020924B9C|nr:hypothetical protein [Actinoallomurus soli]MCO5971559.1 hypothetical protein [Actinoallomurus soli]